jgi:zinc-ribbon domain
MLVCPNCRNENSEDARFCQVCGRGLDPAAAPMRGQRERAEGTADLDVPPPRRTSIVPLLIALATIVTAVVVFSIWYTSRPNPCEGKFSSVLFGYCTEIPEGWRGGSQVTAQENIDEFSPSQDDAVTWVRVREIVDPATQTQQYAQQFRTSQEAEGLDPSRVEVVPLDGEQALAWEVSVPTQDGDPLRIREVVIVREDGAWRITLAATEMSYPDARVGFEELLSAWIWK